MDADKLSQSEQAEPQRRCPVCGYWRWRPDEVPDAAGHHPDCGVNLRHQQQARAARRAWRRRLRRETDNTS